MSTASLTPPDRVAMLRGATVADVDARRLRSAVVIVTVAALGVAAVALFVAGVRKNAEVTSLRQHGVPVVVTVTGCMGLLGGSGSNVAGYACRGTFTMAGRRYVDSIPGNVLRTPGARVAAVTLASDPALLSTRAQVRASRASAKVFVAPALVSAALVALLATAIAFRRRFRSLPRCCAAV